MRKRIAPAPTDEEILALDDVPVETASRYIRMSSPTIYIALQDGRAPFGFAVQNKATGTWTYSISPGGIVKYKREGVPMLGMKEIQADIADGVEQILTAKLGAINQMLSAVVQS